MDWLVCKTCKNMGTTTGVCNSCTKRYSEYVPNREKKQTNADKYFRNATDEELAERLLRMDTICRGAMDGKMPCKNDQYGISCKDCWLDWLKQEAEESED